MKWNRLNFYGATIDAYVMVEIQKPEKPSSAPLWIGILIIIVGLSMALGSIGMSGGIPTTGKASFICGFSLLVGMIPIGNYIVLGHKHSIVVEKETEAIAMKRGIHYPPKVSIPTLCFMLSSFWIVFCKLDNMARRLSFLWWGVIAHLSPIFCNNKTIQS